MIEITDEKFATAYNAANDSIKSLMSSSLIYDSASQLLKQTLSDVEPRNVILPIGYHLLGILDTQKAGQYLESLGIVNGTEFIGKLEAMVFEQYAVAKTNPPEAAIQQNPTEQNLYVSTQDAVLNQATTNPPPLPNDAARWGQV